MNTSFGVGQVLATGFRIWARNFVSFAIISALVYAPVILWGVSAASSGSASYQYAPMLTLALGVLLSSTVTYGAVMELQGQRASVGACIAVGLRRFFPAVGTLLLLALCFLGLGICAGIPTVAITGALAHNDPASIRNTSYIAMAIIGLPMLWLYAMMFVSMQVCVIEKPGIAASLGRSRDLTMGYKWRIAAVCIVLAVLNLGLEWLILAATDKGAHVSAYIYLGLVRMVLVGSLGAVMSAAAYYLLRAEKEGTSADELAQIFG